MMTLLLPALVSPEPLDLAVFGEKPLRAALSITQHQPPTATGCSCCTSWRGGIGKTPQPFSMDVYLHGLLQVIKMKMFLQYNEETFRKFHKLY